MTDKVEDWFIKPLEQHYEKSPKVGVRLTINSELDQFDADTLDRAAKWLKLNRKAMTYPSPAECMEACQRSGAMSPVKMNAAGKMEGQTFGERVAAYAKTLPKDSKVPVIQRWADPPAKTVTTPEWRAWRQYWFDKREKFFLDETAERESWTVPTLMPEQFDPYWIAGDPDGRDD